MKTFKQYLRESQASREAAALHLKYLGFGRYGKDHKLTHNVFNGHLKKFEKPEPYIPPPIDNSAQHEEEIFEEAKKTALRYGFPLSKLKLGDPTKEKFVLNGKEMSSAGAAYADGHIEIYPSNIRYKVEVPGIMAHEIMHQKFRKFINRGVEDQQGLELMYPMKPSFKSPDEYQTYIRHKVMNSPNLQSRFPVYTIQNKMDSLQLIKEDGVSVYSLEYWIHTVKHPEDSSAFMTAVNETLAEMARIREQSYEHYHAEYDKAVETFKNANISLDLEGRNGLKLRVWKGTEYIDPAKLNPELKKVWDHINLEVQEVNKPGGHSMIFGEQGDHHVIAPVWQELFDAVEKYGALE